MPGYEILSLGLLVKGVPETTQTMQAISIALDHPSELEGKTLLLILLYWSPDIMKSS